MSTVCYTPFPSLGQSVKTTQSPTLPAFAHAHRTVPASTLNGETNPATLLLTMSRSNGVLARWGQAKESLWIGHSAAVMKDHYALVSDEDFAEVAGADLESQSPHAHDPTRLFCIRLVA